MRRPIAFVVDATCALLAICSVAGSARAFALTPDPAELEGPPSTSPSTSSSPSTGSSSSSSSFGSPPTVPSRSSTGTATVRVVLLDVVGHDLDAREAEVVRNLIAIRLEKNSALDVTAPATSDAACASPSCLDAVAASQHADFALLAETDALGDALVLTIAAYDVAHAHIVRDAISVKERGDLPDRIGSLVDGMVTTLVARLPAVRRPDLRTRFDQAHIAVCSDGRGWFFCDGQKRAVTENDFVRRYRSETNRHDLDVAEIDRDPNLEPWIFMIGGGATALATVGATVAIGTTTTGQQFARQSEDAWIVLPVIGLSAALALVVYGAIELDDGPHIHDGSELDHVLSEDVGRAAAAAYDDALMARLQREASSSG